MARALIVGCGCRGRELGRLLLDEGWAVRGTSRSAAGLEAITAAGIEAAEADPERPATLVELVADVAVLVLALGSIEGEAEKITAVHGHRLEGLVEKLVDTPVRGVVYETAGSVDPELLAGGAAVLRRANETWRIPVELLDADPADAEAWVEAAAAAVRQVLSPA
jgi:uncharacterized protein YbjT (DUF2867 family)